MIPLLVIALYQTYSAMSVNMFSETYLLTSCFRSLEDIFRNAVPCSLDSAIFVSTSILSSHIEVVYLGLKISVPS